MPYSTGILSVRLDAATLPRTFLQSGLSTASKPHADYQLIGALLRMTESTASALFEDVTCPFCGLACDDLRVKVDSGALEVIGIDCDLSRRGFQQASDEHEISPQVEGLPVKLDEAVGRAAEILRKAKLPVIAGLATDVNGVRAAVALAERSGATVDHMNSPSLFRNLQVLQDGGWMTTSLTETRNRADLIVVAGAHVFELFPRLMERVIRPKKCVPTDAGTARELVLIGPWKPTTLPPELDDWRPTIIPVGLSALGEVVASLRALVAKRPLQVSGIEGVDINTLQNLARRLQQADYSVVAWAASELDFPHAALTVENLVELVRSLNETTRSAALPLGGSQGDVTANEVCVWQSGRPLRTAFGRGHPEHDAVMFNYRRLLSQGADALLWLSSFLPETPPPDADIPLVVLGHPKIRLVQPPTVYIPVGIPGVDHAGHIYRSDAVVSLPLRQLRESRLPAASEILQAIIERL
jgi:formylmethanofuran dehydrogenase subunit B